MKFLLVFVVALAGLGCSQMSVKQPVFKTAREYSKSKEFPSGKLVIVQGPTGSHEANINVLSPRLKNYDYVVRDSAGKTYPVEKYDSVYTEPLHWKVDKIFVTGLQPREKYTLDVIDTFRGSGTRVDQRSFQTLDTEKNSVRFAYASCMADDFRFNEVINPMWNRMQQQNPDLIILNGDVVYVDSFEFVERQKATELDIWFRFIDTLTRLPLYHWIELKPVLATWDDHDFGTNDGDRDFKGKQAARRIFLAFFGGKNIPTAYNLEKDSVYFSFTAFGQKMFFMDDRYFRQPDRNQKIAEKHAQWGEKQHDWLLTNLNTETPAWIFNGNQIFSGTKLSFKEAMQDDHPEHFKTLLEDLKKVSAPVVFASGDIHFSEIMQVPENLLNYKTYEITSSSMHSYTGEGWANPLRVEGAFTTEFNFMMITSNSEKTGLKLDIESWGTADKPYFRKSLEVNGLKR